MGKGAQVSDTVHNFLISSKIITGEKRAAFVPKPKEAKTSIPEENSKETVAEAKAEEAKETETAEIVETPVSPEE
jgi:hypothetical protein